MERTISLDKADGEFTASMKPPTNFSRRLIFLAMDVDLDRKRGYIIILILFKYCNL